MKGPHAYILCTNTLKHPHKICVHRSLGVFRLLLVLRPTANILPISRTSIFNFNTYTFHRNEGGIRQQRKRRLNINVIVEAWVIGQGRTNQHFYRLKCNYSFFFFRNLQKNSLMFKQSDTLRQTTRNSLIFWKARLNYFLFQKQHFARIVRFRSYLTFLYHVLQVLICLS